MKKKAVSRLKRIAGQVEGIGRMVEGDRYCVELLLQIASAQAALNQVSKLILRSHIETCVGDAIAASKVAERNQKLDELMDVFARYGGLGGRAPG